MKRSTEKILRIYERGKGDFTTSRGGSGWNISNNPLSKGGGGGG